MAYIDLFNNSAAAMDVVDMDTHKIVALNPRMQHLLGYTGQELIHNSETVFDVIAMESLEESARAFEQMRSDYALQRYRTVRMVRHYVTKVGLVVKCAVTSWLSCAGKYRIALVEPITHIQQ